MTKGKEKDRVSSVIDKQEAGQKEDDMLAVSVDEEGESKTKDSDAKTDEPTKEESTKVKEEDEALEIRFLRLQADFDNFRKRVQRERGDWYQRGSEDFLTGVLPVLDHFELGLNTAKEHDADPSVLEGFELVYDQLLSLLKKFNVMAMDVEGQPFDPHLHEAMTYMPSEAYPVDVVVSQTRRGYTFKDKLLRPAQVIVSRGLEEDPAPNNETPLSKEKEEKKGD